MSYAEFSDGRVPKCPGAELDTRNADVTKHPPNLVKHKTARGDRPVSTGPSGGAEGEVPYHTPRRWERVAV